MVGSVQSRVCVLSCGGDGSPVDSYHFIAGHSRMSPFPTANPLDVGLIRLALSRNLQSLDSRIPFFFFKKKKKKKKVTVVRLHSSH